MQDGDQMDFSMTINGPVDLSLGVVAGWDHPSQRANACEYLTGKGEMARPQSQDVRSLSLFEISLDGGPHVGAMIHTAYALDEFAKQIDEQGELDELYEDEDDENEE